MKNRIRRLIPDDSWNMGVIEGWLEDMAGQGWLLEKCGRMFATFERWTPRTCRFRVEPLGDRTAPWHEEMEYAELGWRHLCTLEDLRVLYCLDPEAPELQTDPVAENWLVEKLLKKTRRRLLLTWMFLLGCLAVWGVLLLRSQTPVEDLILGTGAEILFGCLLLPWLVWETVRALRRIGRMRRQAAAGFPRVHTGDWKKNRRRAAAGLMILLLFYAVWLGYPLWQLWAAHEQETMEIPLLMGYQLDPELDKSRQSADIRTQTPSLLSPIHGDIWETYSGSGEPTVFSEYFSLRFAALAEALYAERVERVRAAWPGAQVEEMEVPGIDHVTLVRTEYNTFLVACRGRAEIYVGAFGVQGLGEHLEDYADILGELQ